MLKALDCVVVFGGWRKGGSLLAGSGWSVSVGLVLVSVFFVGRLVCRCGWKWRWMMRPVECLRTGDGGCLRGGFLGVVTVTVAMASRCR